MVTLTTDQYYALAQLDKWYRKYNHQFIEISGIVGTGIWDVIQAFIDGTLDPREVMYLSYNQHQVLQLAAKGYHSYYVNGIIYKYDRIVDLDSLPVLNSKADGVLRYTWKKRVRKKVDSKYKLMVIFDSSLLNYQTINDIKSFGLPIILIRDPMLLPAPDAHTFLRDPNIVMREIHPTYAKSPIVHFAHKMMMGEKLIPGNYDAVSIVPKSQMNLYNLKSSDMNITLTDDSRAMVNSLFRQRILNRKDTINIVGERLIVMDTMYGERLTNPDNKKIKVYLPAGSVGNITKINRHAAIRKYVPINFRLGCYHEEFEDLCIDRHYLNGIISKSRQMIPDSFMRVEYAYALTPQLARLNYWDKITLIMDPNDMPYDLYIHTIYTAITRAKKAATIII